MAASPGCAFLVEATPDEVSSFEDFTEEQRAMARTAEEFVDRGVVPRLAEIQEKKLGVVPDLLRRAGETACSPSRCSEAHGGLGLDKATERRVSGLLRRRTKRDSTEDGRKVF